MTRRGFLHSLGLVAVTPSVVPLVAERCAAVPSFWGAATWWEKEFDYGRVLGFCMEVTNVITGQVARHAVRLTRPLGMTLRESTITGRKLAKTILRTWAEDLPGGWLSKTSTGYPGMQQVIEQDQLETPYPQNLFGLTRYKLRDQTRPA